MHLSQDLRHRRTSGAPFTWVLVFLLGLGLAAGCSDSTSGQDMAVLDSGADVTGLDLPQSDAETPDSTPADAPAAESSQPDLLQPDSESPDSTLPDSAGDWGVPSAPVATWELNGMPTSPWPVTKTAPNVTASALTMTGVTPMNFVNAFVGNNWPAGPINMGKYFQFSVTAAAAHIIRYNTVRFSLYNNHDGLCTWELRSSVDNYASAIAQGTASKIYQPGVPITADVSSLGSKTGTVVFRFYTYNNSGTTSPLQRGFRGSTFGGLDLKIWGAVN